MIDLESILMKKELEKAGFTTFSKHEFTEVMFKTTGILYDFSQEEIKPLLEQVIKPSPKETALEVEKYRQFPEIEKYRVAKQIDDFCGKNPSINTDFSIFQNYVKDKQKETEVFQLLSTLWGKVTPCKTKEFPRHWTGKDLRKRAADLGPKYEEIYLESYPKLSWFIHSGSTCYKNLYEEFFVQFFALCHDRVHKRFLEAILEIAQEFHLDKAIDDFYYVITNLEKVPAFIVFEDKFKQLKQKH